MLLAFWYSKQGTVATLLSLDSGNGATELEAGSRYLSTVIFDIPNPAVKSQCTSYSIMLMVNSCCVVCEGIKQREIEVTSIDLLTYAAIVVL